MISVRIRDFEVSNKLPFVFIGGPCAIESREHSEFIGGEIKAICADLGINYIFKSSFDKANRTSISGKRGVGMKQGLEILGHVREKLNVPVLTDVHLPDQCAVVAAVVDILQIPAFMCRQTDLLAAAAATGKVVNVKKGQFVSPYDMQNVVTKLRYHGAENIMLCERGTFFGYGNLVNDFRGIPIMAIDGYPVIFDATHSTQKPSSRGDASGGEREFAPILARAAVAVGVAGVFMEVHEKPDEAPCDGANMLYLRDLKQVLTELLEIDVVAKKYMRALVSSANS
ncbi:MAG: 3-deoxy-8-phosphooctulonate synthase [Holosporales bacterium]|nr:3-deoxy-8-phosphooctulonate synthase [Holosporales bacterium]